jgi:hypothetical protein
MGDNRRTSLLQDLKHMICGALWASSKLAAIQKEHAFVRVLSQLRSPILKNSNDARQV